MGKFKLTLIDEDAIYDRCINTKTNKVPIQNELDDIRIALAGVLRGGKQITLLVDTQTGRIDLEGI